MPPTWKNLETWKILENPGKPWKTSVFPRKTWKNLENGDEENRNFDPGKTWKTAILTLEKPGIGPLVRGGNPDSHWFITATD